MNDFDLTVAAFVKMAKGEPLSITDAQRVFTVFINNPPQIDSQNQQQVQQVMSQLKEGLQRTYLQ